VKKGGAGSTAAKCISRSIYVLMIQQSIVRLLCAVHVIQQTSSWAWFLFC
jgi:hypothetical protein